MSILDQLKSIAEKRILILDGAMGSMIQSLDFHEKDFRTERFASHTTPLNGCNDLLCLVKPDEIGSIHNAYLQAGADIIETCSFNSTSISLSDYGLGEMAYEISEAAAKIARKSADKFSTPDKPRFVAGSIGPTAKGASLYPDINNPGKRSISWDELEAAYYDNARGLLDGGVDILIIETVFDTLNAKAALFAVSRLLEERRANVPVIISAAVSGDSARLLSGQSLEAFCVSVQHAAFPNGSAPFAVGVNCSFSAEKLLPIVRRLSEAVPCFVSVYPNAGLPNRFGRYEETPQIMSANIENYFKEGLVNIAGGCCGSTPDHIAQIAKKAQGYKPRSLPALSGVFYSGFDILRIENNTVRINNADNAAEEEFFDSIEKGEYEDAVDTARDIVDNGAPVVNFKTNNEESARKFLDFALMNPYVAKAPFVINSPHFKIIEASLKRLQGRSIAGPVSLKDGEEAEFLRKAELILHYGAAVLITLTAENEQTDTAEQKIELAQRIYSLLQKNNYPAGNIVFEIPPGQIQICDRLRDNCLGAVLAV